MTTRRHLTALPKGTAFPVDTTDLPDGYPFLRSDEGALYEWDLATSTWVVVAGGGGGGGSLNEVVSYYQWEGEVPDTPFPSSGSSYFYLTVPSDEDHEMWVQGAGVLPLPYLDYRWNGEGIFTQAVFPPGTWALYVDTYWEGLVPGDGIEFRIEGTDEGDFGPRYMFTVPYGRNWMAPSFQFVSGSDGVQKLSVQAKVWFASGAPTLNEYGMTARMLTAVDPDFQPPPVLAPDLVITSPGTGQINVAWTGGLPFAGSIYLFDPATGLTYSEWVAPSGFTPTTNHLFTGITSGLKVRAAVVPYFTVDARGSMTPDDVTVA